MSGYVVREARQEDLPSLAAVERAAQAMFARAGLPELVEAPVLSLDEVEEYAAAGFVAVAEHARDGIVGFVVARPLGGAAHVQELDVHPDHGGQGLGRALLDRALGWGRDAGFALATLSTFRDVPWNAPFYARVGFRAIAPEEASAALRALRDQEPGWGLDVARRVLMVLDLRRNVPGPETFK
jgi:GNAT superfamily N-acetyltransferase